jgi:hypothetical protein
MGTILKIQIIIIIQKPPYCITKSTTQKTRDLLLRPLLFTLLVSDTTTQPDCHILALPPRLSRTIPLQASSP